MSGIRDVEAAGSNPVTPIKTNEGFEVFEALNSGEDNEQDHSSHRTGI